MVRFSKAALSFGTVALVAGVVTLDI